MTTAVVLCSTCGQWPLAPARDRFCSWCGTPLRRIEIVHGPTGDKAQGGRIRHHLTSVKGEGFDLFVTPSGGVPVRIREVRTEAEGLSFRVRGKKGETTEHVRVEVDAARREETSEIWIETEDGEVDRLVLEVLPAPSLVFEPGDGVTEAIDGKDIRVAFTRPEAKTEVRRLRFRVRGSAFAPTAVAISGEGAAGLVARSGDVGRDLPEGGGLSIEVERTEIWRHGEDRKAVLSVSARGLAQPIALPIRLGQRRREGGVFQPERVLFPSVTIGFDTRRNLSLVNKDDYPLGVRGVRPGAPWIEVGWERKGQAGSPMPVTPFRLEPGASRAFVVRLLTEHPEFPKPGSGAVAVKAAFDLEMEDPARVEFEVAVDAIQGAQTMAGFLAIDFGTTNTCVAIGGEGVEPRVLEIGGDVSIPSILYFEDVSDPQRPRYQVGQKARALVRMGAKEALVKNVKRRLGIERPERVFDRQGNSAWYTAEELAGFYLKEVVRQAEEAIKASDAQGARIEEVVFTYPVLFSDSQVAAIGRILGKRIGIPRVHRSLDEANAGAIRFVYAEALEELHRLKKGIASGATSAARRRTEYVINYDFGGGTIDIALLRLDYDFDAERVVSTPIGVTGFYRFGGEDVTVVVRDIVLEKIRKRVPRVRIPCGDPDLHPAEYEAIRGNNYLLWFLAETAKKGIYTDPRTYRVDPDGGFFNDLMVDSGRGLEPVGPQNPLFRGLADEAARVTITRDEVDERIRDRVAASIERAYNLWRFTLAHGQLGLEGGARPDRVILTGRSSSIPLVAELFAKRFGLAADKIVFRPDQAKRVVVEGACFYRAFESAAIEGLEFLVGDAASRIPVPLGIQKTVHGRPCFAPLFLNGQPLELDPEATKRLGEKVYSASRVEELRLDRPVVYVKICRNLNYTDEVDLRSGAEKIGFFEIRREDPFFADWPDEALRRVPCRFRLEKRPGSGRYSIEAIFTRPDGIEKALEFHFEDHYLAAVPEGEEATGGGSDKGA